MRKNVIVISGTPGVGKTSIAKMLARKLNGVYLNLTELVLNKKLYVDYDPERESYIIDEEKVRKEILKISIKHQDKYVIIDSHYGELTPREVLYKIFVIRCNPLTLAQRLKERGWKELKIRENVQAEILGICTANAIEEHGEDLVYEIDVTNKSVNEVVNEILRLMSEEPKCRKFIDWLSIIPLEKLSTYLT
ncbi:MAG TPA: AAA family ATPase [Desulfurococcales archaeon]|nr:AAA family ATPase [Desulfurococcales archaeon]